LKSINCFRNTRTEDRADINSTGLEHRTALHWAVYENKMEAVKILIKYGANVEARTDKNRTPLHIASILGQISICQVLLESRACVDAQDKDNNTPFHYSAFYSILHYFSQ
jgi:ankyrin repeat protein